MRFDQVCEKWVKGEWNSCDMWRYFDVFVWVYYATCDEWNIKREFEDLSLILWRPGCKLVYLVV